jgi:hypothetical protein
MVQATPRPRWVAKPADLDEGDNGCPVPARSVPKKPSGRPDYANDQVVEERNPRKEPNVPSSLLG